MNFKILFGMIFTCFASVLLWSEANAALARDETYFSYSESELSDLRAIPVPKQKLTPERFAEWDPIVYQLTRGDQRLEGAANRFMTYLYVGQRDFALLSHQISHDWTGNPAPMIAKAIHIFYPDYQLPPSRDEDLFSQKLSELVVRKIAERYQLEESQLREYPKQEGLDRWVETPPIVGRRIGSCKPWLLASLNDFQAAIPPSPQSIIWVYGIEQIKAEQSHLTEEQIRLIRYWAGEFGPESGNWFAIVNQTLKEKQLALTDFLFIRAVYAMGHADSMIASFDSKYKYWVMRPHMRDPMIRQIVPVPKHPSYPAGHSVHAATAAVILSHFFPVDKQKWQQLAIQSGSTRVWGGLHFVFDNEQGLILGEKVGHAVINRVAADLPPKR